MARKSTMSVLERRARKAQDTELNTVARIANVFSEVAPERFWVAVSQRSGEGPRIMVGITGRFSPFLVLFVDITNTEKPVKWSYRFEEGVEYKDEDFYITNIEGATLENMLLAITRYLAELARAL